LFIGIDFGDGVATLNFMDAFDGFGLSPVVRRASGKHA